MLVYCSDVRERTDRTLTAVFVVNRYTKFNKGLQVKINFISIDSLTTFGRVFIDLICDNG